MSRRAEELRARRVVSGAKIMFDVDAREPYIRLAATPAELQATRVCHCEACERDGQHAASCAVHGPEEPAGACDCARSA